MDETQREADKSAKDAHHDEARVKAYFPEGILTVLAILCVVGAVATAVAGLALAQAELLSVVVGLLIAAFQIAVVRVLIGALYDIREYLARLSRK